MSFATNMCWKTGAPACRHTVLGMYLALISSTVVVKMGRLWGSEFLIVLDSINGQGIGRKLALPAGARTQLLPWAAPGWDGTALYILLHRLVVVNH